MLSMLDGKEKVILQQWRSIIWSSIAQWPVMYYSHKLHSVASLQRWEHIKPAYVKCYWHQIHSIQPQASPMPFEHFTHKSGLSQLIFPGKEACGIMRQCSSGLYSLQFRHRTKACIAMRLSKNTDRHQIRIPFRSCHAVLEINISPLHCRKHCEVFVNEDCFKEKIWAQFLFLGWILIVLPLMQEGRSVLILVISPLLLQPPRKENLPHSVLRDGGSSSRGCSRKGEVPKSPT